MTWEEIVARSEFEETDPRLIFQEEVQKSVLTALSLESAFESIVFQGGTALRFFAGDPRFSEDLDFVLRKADMHYDLTEKLKKLEKYIGHQLFYIDDVRFKVQKNERDLQRVVLKTGSDIPGQRVRVRLELFFVPSYYNHPMILDNPPVNPAIRVEKPVEILADKIVALANRPYLKGRDIWDAYFLVKEKGVGIDWELVLKKARDYGIEQGELEERCERAGKDIELKGKAALSNEMARFMPRTILNQYKGSFDDIVLKVADVVRGDEGR